MWYFGITGAGRKVGPLFNTRFVRSFLFRAFFWDVGEIMKKSTIAFFLAAGSFAFGLVSSAKAANFDIGLSGLTLTYSGSGVGGSNLTVTGGVGSGYVVNGAPQTTGVFSFTGQLVSGGAEALNLAVTGGPTVTDATPLGATPFMVSAGDTYVLLTGWTFNGSPEPGTAQLRLSAFDATLTGTKTIAGETADLIFSTPAPLPGTAWAAGALLTGLGAYRRFRRPVALS